MTPLPKHLEEMRDELWTKHKDNNAPIGQAKFYYKDNEQYYKRGVMDMASIMLKDMESMAKAVDNVCKEQSVLDFETHVHELREALKNYREKYEK